MKNLFSPLVRNSVKRTFRAGSTILYQGEVPRSACILLSGVVRVFSISPQGDDQIVNLHVAGEFFPSSWIFGKGTSTLFFYEALTDCEVAFVPRREFIEYMTTKSERMHALLDYFTTSYAAWMIRVNALEQPKARDKLAYTMYFLCERYAKKNASGEKTISIPIALTHQHFASLVGLTRETTAMELNKLRRQGVISYKRQFYTVNINKLMHLINEDSFRGLSISEEVPQV